MAKCVQESCLMNNWPCKVIPNCLDTKQWQIGHITRLRTAGMEDIVID